MGESHSPERPSADTKKYSDGSIRAPAKLTKLDRAYYVGCLKVVSKSIQVLLNGLEQLYGTDFDNFEIASPAGSFIFGWRDDCLLVFWP